MEPANHKTTLGPAPAIALLLLPGLAVFLLDQVFTARAAHQPMTIATGASYIAAFLLAALPALVLARLSAPRPGASLPRLFFAAAALNLIYIVLIFGAAALGHNVLGPGKKHLVLVAAFALLAAAAGWRLRRGPLPTWATLPAAGLVFLFIIAAAVLCPEQIFLAPPPAVWLNALYLVSGLTLLYRLRSALPISGRWDVLALAALLGLNLLFHAAMTRREQQKYRAQAPLAPGLGFSDSAPRPPHIIFIVWDTVRRDHLSVYGYDRDTTPYLAERAKQSLVYTNAVTVAPWTLPSHVSMFTGKYPREHGAHRMIRTGNTKPYLPMAPSPDNLAQKLHHRGYQCGAVSANHVFAGREAALDHSFDYFEDQENPGQITAERFELQKYLLGLARPLFPADFFARHFNFCVTADTVTDRALHWLDTTAPDRPVFLFLNYMDAHHPFYPPGRLLDRFPGVDRDIFVDDTELRTEILKKGIGVTPEQREHYRSIYDAEIVFLDEQLKVLEDGLRERGLYDNAFIFLVGDHGEHLGEKNFVGHGHTLYREDLEVPLIVKAPHDADAGTNGVLFENRMIYYSILAAAGVEAPPPPTPEWNALAEVYPWMAPDNELRYFNTANLQRAVWFDGYKLIISTSGQRELFDLAQDPGEDRNLADGHPELVERGMSLIESFLAATSDGAKLREEELKNLSPEELKNLRDLGYIQ